MDNRRRVCAWDAAPVRLVCLQFRCFVSLGLPLYGFHVFRSALRVVSGVVLSAHPNMDILSVVYKIHQCVVGQVSESE